MMALSACQGQLSEHTSNNKHNHFGMPGGILTPGIAPNSLSPDADAPAVSGHFIYDRDHRRAVTSWHPTEWAHLAIRRDRDLDAPIYHYGGGFDAQIRLNSEGDLHPAVALGIRSMIGSGEEGAEYAVASKQIGPARLSLGVGTGQLAATGGIDHPLQFLGGRFEQSAARAHRDVGPDIWGGGDKIGFFGNLRLDLPVPNLDLVTEIGGDEDSTARIGLDWQALPHVNLGIAADQERTIQARLSVRLDPIWRRRERPPTAPVTPLTARPTEDPVSRMELLGMDQPPQIKDLPAPGPRDHTLLLTQSGIPVTGIVIPARKPAPPPPKEPTPEEQWQRLLIAPRTQPLDQSAAPALAFEIAPTLIVDPYEPRNTALHRSYLDLAATAAPGGGVRFGANVRVNAHHDLDKLRRNRQPSLLPVRSDIAAYADHTAWLEHLYLAQFSHPLPNLYALGYGGFLEETHAGFGGDLLYRPDDQKWDIGGGIAIAQKRDPEHMTRLLALPTAHVWDITAGYEINDHTWATLGAGRYLAGDTGPQLSLVTRWDDGTRLEGWARWSNPGDLYWLAEKQDGDFGFRLSMPFGVTTSPMTRLQPKFSIEPLGRDAVQTLKKPLDLRDMTRPARMIPP